MRAVLVVATALAGVVLVGPALNRAILWWVGRQVVVPTLLGRPVDPGELARVPARCAGCGAVVEYRPSWPRRRPGSSSRPTRPVRSGSSGPPRCGSPGPGPIGSGPGSGSPGSSGSGSRPPERSGRAGRARPRWPGLLPWAAVGGRCRGCGLARPRWTGVVEAATGLGFGAAAARYGPAAELPAVLALVAGLVAVSAVDLAYLRIPTVFVHASGAAVAGAMALAALVSGPLDAVAGAAVGAGIYGGFLGLAWFVSPRALGFGDVRLGTLIGAVVGWLAWTPERPLEGPVVGVLDAALAAGLFGTVVGTVLLIVRRANRPFAFGPAMAAGAVAVVLGAGPPG